MNDKTIRGLAVLFALTIFSIIKLFEPCINLKINEIIVTLFIPGAMPELNNFPSKASLSGINIAIVTWSGVKLGFLIIISEYTLYWLFTKQFIGTWAYESSSGNFAIVKIFPKGLWSGGITLSYNVSLFKTPREVISALKVEGIAFPFGTAYGQLVGLKDDKLIIVYQVSLGADPFNAFRGILTITPTADKNILSGVWESTKVNRQHPIEPDEKVRKGDLKIYRPKNFRKKFSEGCLPLSV